uniref:UDP-galactopyranose mutase n=1 Tax=Flavobacterium sp. TaxID=239 RepID=UPI00404A76C0
MIYDYLIVGSGFFGSICAHELHKAGRKVLVIDSRDHIGGNCYTEKRDGINLHVYGAHIFHTSNKEVWQWINQFAEFNTYRHHVLATYDNEIYSLPFSMWTFNKIWGIHYPHEAQEIINKQSSEIIEPTNLEEQAIKLVGNDVYEKLIKGYTHKQWMKHPKDLPKEIIKRLPVRFTWDNNYFYDIYQGIPIGGYTQIFEKLLEGIDLQLNTDYFTDNLPIYKKVIYTGPIDKFFGYKYGELEYKTVRFEHENIKRPNYQGISVMNFTNYNIPYTRIIEHKHFEGVDTDSTWISHEYPIEYKAGFNEPYYPVNDKYNNGIYEKYKIEAAKIKESVLFGGRLGEYKYFDMHQIVESALGFIKSELRTIF